MRFFGEEFIAHVSGTAGLMRKVLTENSTVPGSASLKKNLTVTDCQNEAKPDLTQVTECKQKQG